MRGAEDAWLIILRMQADKYYALHALSHSLVGDTPI